MDTKTITTPYILRFSHNQKSLTVVGVRHSFSIESEEIRALIIQWGEFLQLNGSKIALGERRDVTPLTTLEESAQKKGEAGVLYWLAREAHVPALCPDKSLREVWTELCQFSNPEDIAYYMIATTIPWRLKLRPDLSLNEWLALEVRHKTEAKDIFGFEPTIEWFAEKHRQLFGNHPIDDADFYLKKDTAFASHESMATIFRETSRIRNAAIVDGLNNVVRTYDHVFMVYGLTHVLAMQEEMHALFQ